MGSLETASASLAASLVELGLRVPQRRPRKGEGRVRGSQFVLPSDPAAILAA